jgi:alpha-beta hydrolase superfamily lysophospholipase
MTSIRIDESACRERRLTLAVSGWEIPAALTVPASGAPESAILLVPGSLFSDVNGDYPVWNMRPHVYGHLARQLSARGHAVYRYAKMGPGTGSVAVDQSESERVKNWPGRVVVARAALAAMRTALADSGWAATPTVLAGHSEGAVVASLLAAEPDAAPLDGVVLLSGPSIGILGIMREQLGTFLPAGDLDAARADFDAGVAFVRRGEAIPPDLEASPSLRGLVGVGRMGQAYLAACDASDPCAAAARIAVPVLIVQGGRDGSVPPHHADRLRAARGDRPTESLFVAELTHMYKVLPDGVSGLEAFGLEGETDPRVADGMDAWVRKLQAAR